MNEKSYYFYFPHYSNMHRTPEAVALRSVYGWAGYGRFQAICEHLREQPGYAISTESKYWLSSLTELLKFDSREDCEKFIADLVDDFELLKRDESFLWCPTLSADMEPLDKKRQEYIERGRKGAEVTNAKKAAKKSAQAKNINGTSVENERLSVGTGEEKSGKERKKRVEVDEIKEEEEEKRKILEVEVRERGETAQPAPTLFRDSKYFDFEKFREALEDSDYAMANVKWYYERLLTWSDSGHQMKVDWLATVKSWIMKDIADTDFKDKNFKPKPKNGKVPTGADVESISAFGKIELLPDFSPSLNFHNACASPNYQLLREEVLKLRRYRQEGREVSESEINPDLFDFLVEQEHISKDVKADEFGGKRSVVKMYIDDSVKCANKTKSTGRTLTRDVL